MTDVFNLSRQPSQEDVLAQLGQIKGLHTRIALSPTAPNREAQLDKLEEKHAAILAANPDLTSDSAEQEAAKLAANQLRQQAIEARAQELIEQADTSSPEKMLESAEGLTTEQRKSRA